MRRTGFTLIELLVALSIFAVVSASIYFSFLLGIKAWSKFEGDIKIYLDARLVSQKFTRDISSLFIPQNKDIESFEIGEKTHHIKFIGGTDSIRFFSLDKRGIFQAEYHLVNGDDDDRGNILELNISRCEHIEALRKGEVIEKIEKYSSDSIPLSDKISRLEFTYYSTGEDGEEQVYSSWNLPEEIKETEVVLPDIPERIEMLLGFVTKEDRMINFEDSFVIPVGMQIVIDREEERSLSK